MVITIFATQEVWIRDDLGLDMERETLFHEILHICNFISGIDDNSLKIIEEEFVVRVTSPILYSILNVESRIGILFIWRNIMKLLALVVTAMIGLAVWREMR